MYIQKKIPLISKQIFKDVTFNVLERKYSLIGPMWVSNQVEWLTGVYATFKDNEKFLITIYLIKKNFGLLLKKFY